MATISTVAAIRAAYTHQVYIWRGDARPLDGGWVREILVYASLADLRRDRDNSLAIARATVRARG